MAENSYPTNAMIDAALSAIDNWSGGSAREAVRAAIIAAERAAWRPIEEANKGEDKTPVLLNRAPFEDHVGGVTFGYWYVEEHGQYLGDCGGECRCPEYGEPCEPYWWSEDGGFTQEHPPTHFRPLPLSPDNGEDE